MKTGPLGWHEWNTGLLSYHIYLGSLALLSKFTVEQVMAVFVIYLKDLKQLNFFRLLKNAVNANSQYCIKCVHLEVCALLVQL